MSHYHHPEAAQSSRGNSQINKVEAGSLGYKLYCWHREEGDDSISIILPADKILKLCALTKLAHSGGVKRCHIFGSCGASSVLSGEDGTVWKSIDVGSQCQDGNEQRGKWSSHPLIACIRWCRRALSII